MNRKTYKTDTDVLNVNLSETGLRLDSAMRALLDSLNEGFLVADRDGRICFGNKAYLRFLEKNLEEVEGRMLKELRPGAVLPDVIKSGKPMLHVPRMEVGETYFCNMYPIFREGEIIGGVSVVTFISDAHNFKEELEAYEKRKQKLIQSINKANRPRYTFADIVAKAPSSAASMAMAQRIAGTDATVLLESESGTGKELYAQAIHNASHRRDFVFIAVNCANFNENILESELFGYTEGAFTGAKKGGKIGLFEAAGKGTLFLDEISEMDIGLQAKLLRVIQEGRIRPVGGNSEISVDVRIICACNQDLKDCVDKGRFRKDLYYRLSSFPIRIPPLRERDADIPVLIETVLQEISRKMKQPLVMTAEAVECLKSYDWPGNVRELRNVLEFCAYLSDNGTVGRESLPPHIGNIVQKEDSLRLSERVREYERREILRLLSVNGNDLKGKRKTAGQLGISLASLYNKLGK